MKYETQCQAASYNPDQDRCLLHSKHPLNATAQVSNSNGYRLYYSKFGECDNGWLKFGDRCYFFNSNPLTWDQAMAACNLLRSNLLKIENSAENDFVRTKCIEYGGHFYWIGARYSTQYGQYTWYDGTTLDYTRWNPGEPDTIGCVDLLHLYNYNWNDHPDCNTYGESICERGLFD
ncbi:perlucin-like [Ruditapes philippinarum]|uniref:perlucin-like n=1 Tax=Ruditapes philippinarum TaxID=129788 RepID=UPI00295B149E|nr:perlucin-like [Ruditapes philippinarum]